MKPKSTEEMGRRFAAIFDAAEFAIININDRGVIEDFSPSAEKMFGYVCDEVIGQNVNVLMPEPFRGAHDSYIDNYLSTGNKKIIGIGREVTAARKDGTTFPIHLTVSEVRLNDGRIFTGMIEDLTARVSAENRVRTLQSELVHVARVSAMGEMASALAHELNQPLTAISNYASAAQRILASGHDGATEKAAALCLKAGAQAQRAGEIIRRLRQFIEGGATERAWYDIKPTIEEAASLCFVDPHARSIHFELDVPSDFPKVFIDRVQIQQVFQNLVRNAVDALEDTNCDKRIAISLRRVSEHDIEAVVCDTGPGISDDIKSRLFETFVTSKPNGMGIGLSVTRNIVEAHGGQISAEDRPGGGTRFIVRLPISET